MKHFYHLVLLLFPIWAIGQTDSVKNIYIASFNSLSAMLEGKTAPSFKKAVFITENAFTGDQMEFEKFDAHIRDLALIASLWMTANPLKNYPYKDSIDFHRNLAIFKLMKDTLQFMDKGGKIYKLMPYTYDFTDFFGRKDWGYMFVSKLLATKKGNCHSLPYLYKIIADELNATCWLSLAPNHMYIKNRCKKIGCYNTELTSGEFPIDAWITASGYIPVKAIQTGLYMDTLSNTQSIALCVLDLAKEYEFQTHNYYDDFILKCCDIVLQYHPANAQAILLKAETMKHICEKQARAKDTSTATTFTNMQALYSQLFDLGYREMPDEMYLNWLNSINAEKNKYNNKGINSQLH